MTSHHTNAGDAPQAPRFSGLPPETPRFLTRTQAADYADVSVSTIDRWVREGLLTKHVAFGGRRVMVDRYEIDRAMNPVPIKVRFAASGE